MRKRCASAESRIRGSLRFMAEWNRESFRRPTRYETARAPTAGPVTGDAQTGGYFLLSFAAALWAENVPSIPMGATLMDPVIVPLLSMVPVYVTSNLLPDHSV